jgi:exopolysaccharide biosynthesis protein
MTRSPLRSSVATLVLTTLTTLASLANLATPATFATVTLALALPAAQAQRLELPEAKQVAPGVLLYHVTDRALVNAEGPLSIWLLSLDPARVDLRSVLANDEVVDTEVVAGIAERHHAVAAVNAGFFAPNGDPAGVLTVDGTLVSDTRRARGAVGIVKDASGLKLLFARLRATATLTVQNGRARTTTVVDGVDTTRQLGKLMLFTPHYHANTDTAPGGLEWVVSGTPPRVVSGPSHTGKTPIPPNGFVLSYGGTTPPAPLAKVKRGTRVSITASYEPVEGPREPWSSARDIVGGAGLLVRDGRDVEDWTIEAFNQGFADNRHPRTLIGTAADGRIWLLTVDGRQPQLSIGMTLRELRALAHSLDLVNALNLDGGGSTTMWVEGQILNSPSDLAGPRKVSDALLVYSVGTR